MMKLQFKHQQFQADAARAVVDVFEGQREHSMSAYRVDPGRNTESYEQMQMESEAAVKGWRNHPLDPELTDAAILNNLRKIQLRNGIEPSDRLEGNREAGYNLTVEMETGTGKTYTYIKTMYELHKAYGWSKYIIVVPSIAIREGVYKSFQMTADHFNEEYGQKIRCFIYRSSCLTEIEGFASGSAIHAMIINSQAFNARGQDARRIYMELDEFRSRKPIDVIAATHPILIIDEPQSVEGKQTKERLKDFRPLLTLRYSATHRKDSIYNMVYRLDAVDAYNRHLVKKIVVKGIEACGNAATEGYLYLEGINLSHASPTVTIQFDMKSASGIRTVTRTAGVHCNLYDQSGGLEEYRHGFVITSIDGRDNTVEFQNGLRLHPGDVIGDVSEEQMRRIQIRETILSHIERERALFARGIKVLSLFFIDEVSHYRRYDEAGRPVNGQFAQMFEEEYRNVTGSMQMAVGEDDYFRYLESIPVEATHAGYFSVDRKGRMQNSREGREKQEDTDTYDLIMKNKELLLDRDPKRSPVRFIFSHSALREGWDNPNVFQICTLKQSSSEIRKRQEVGRGLRLSVNQDGIRMDEAVLPGEVQDVNVLTVIASESYDSFARGLQSELAEAVADRPVRVTVDLFMNRILKKDNGEEIRVDAVLAKTIVDDLQNRGYVDASTATLTEAYHQAEKDNSVQMAEDIADCTAAIVDILHRVYNPKALEPGNARDDNVRLQCNDEKLHSARFMELWDRICTRSVYRVDFDTEHLVRSCIHALNERLRVPRLYFLVESGTLEEIDSRETLEEGSGFKKDSSMAHRAQYTAGSTVKYDLIGKLVEETGLTRRAVADILTGIQPQVFQQYKENPKEFILRASILINEQKASVVVAHITYHPLDERYDMDTIFMDTSLKGRLGINALKVNRHVYDHVLCDSKNEMEFVSQLDVNPGVEVYAKLPKGFFIPTPMGHYTPDWAVAFREDSGVKHIYFVAETKGGDSPLVIQLRGIEEKKIECARKHFDAISEAISENRVVYDVVTSYQQLLEKVML